VQTIDAPLNGASTACKWGQRGWAGDVLLEISGWSLICKTASKWRSDNQQDKLAAAKGWIKIAEGSAAKLMIARCAKK
jgi:hypothetical protein